MNHDPNLVEFRESKVYYQKDLKNAVKYCFVVVKTFCQSFYSLLEQTPMLALRAQCTAT